MRGIQYYNRCKQYGDVGVWMHPIFYRLLQENLGGSIMTRVKAIYVTAVALSLTLPIFSKPTVSVSQTEVPLMTVGYKGGQVSDVRPTSIEIDQRSYEVKVDAIILDHKGNSLE